MAETGQPFVLCCPRLRITKAIGSTRQRLSRTTCGWPTDAEMAVSMMARTEARRLLSGASSGTPSHASNTVVLTATGSPRHVPAIVGNQTHSQCVPVGRATDRTSAGPLGAHPGTRCRCLRTPAPAPAPPPRRPRPPGCAAGRPSAARSAWGPRTQRCCRCRCWAGLGAARRPPPHSSAAHAPGPACWVERKQARRRQTLPLGPPPLRCRLRSALIQAAALLGCGAASAARILPAAAASLPGRWWPCR